MRLALALSLAALVTAALPLAHAGDDGGCSCKGNVCLGTVTIGSGRAYDPVPTIYVDDRNYLFGNGIWIYIESNGHDGLQRGGSSPFIPSDNKICTDDPNYPPDTLVF